MGSNQVREAWLDEGLTEYSTILYFEKKYGKDTAHGLFEHLIKKGTTITWHRHGTIRILE